MVERNTKFTELILEFTYNFEKTFTKIYTLLFIKLLNKENFIVVSDNELKLSNQKKIKHY